MGFWDVLFGRTRLRKPQKEPMFALPGARLTLETSLGWEPAGRAGVCLKSPTSSDFARTEADVLQLATLAAADFRSDLHVVKDQLGFLWLVAADEDLEDLTAIIHLIGQTLDEEGYGGQLLAAVFRFRPAPQPRSGDSPLLYLVYSYKRGLFYPFIPKQGTDRDLAGEMRVAAAMGRELPLDQDQTRWFPINDCPV